MKVMVAMSGGVDSAVAAALLVEQGHDVVGVHLKLHDHAAPDPGARSCCGLDDALDARRVADRLGIPFYVFNLKDAFEKAVIDDFVDAWVTGRTPNPCVQCNGVVKFGAMLQRALALGCDRLATGHYARTDGRSLFMAADRAKDQSYFLWPVRPEALERTLFPLGDLTKPEVRAIARRHELTVADKPESQEVCFVPDGDHGAFVAAHRPDVDASGEIVDTAGRVLGHHDGTWNFTVGQRRGIGVALGVPAWVVRIEPETRRVVVSVDPRAGHHASFEAADVLWRDRPAPVDVVTVRVRHRGALHPCTVADGDVVRFVEPARAVAPGQSAVFYVGDRVIGGARIARVVEAPVEAIQATVSA